MVLLLVPDKGELAREAAGEGQGDQPPICQAIRGCQPGDKGDAKPLLHRQHHRLQGVEFKPWLPAGQLGLDLLDKLLAAARLCFTQYPGLAPQTGEGELLLVGKRVTGWGHHQHLVLQPGFGEQVGVVVLPLDQCHIQLEVGQRMTEQVSVVDGHLGGEPQLLFAAGEQGGEQVVADGLAGTKAKLAARLGIGAEQVLDILHPGQQLFSSWLQQAPLVVELQSGVNAVK